MAELDAVLQKNGCRVEQDDKAVFLFTDEEQDPFILFGQEKKFRDRNCARMFDKHSLGLMPERQLFSAEMVTVMKGQISTPFLLPILDNNVRKWCVVFPESSGIADKALTMDDAAWLDRGVFDGWRVEGKHFPVINTLRVQGRGGLKVFDTDHGFEVQQQSLEKSKAREVTPEIADEIFQQAMLMTDKFISMLEHLEGQDLQGASVFQNLAEHYPHSTPTVTPNGAWNLEKMKVRGNELGMGFSFHCASASHCRSSPTLEKNSCIHLHQPFVAELLSLPATERAHALFAVVSHEMTHHILNHSEIYQWRKEHHQRREEHQAYAIMDAFNFALAKKSWIFPALRNYGPAPEEPSAGILWMLNSKNKRRFLWVNFLKPRRKPPLFLWKNGGRKARCLQKNRKFRRTACAAALN